MIRVRNKKESISNGGEMRGNSKENSRGKEVYSTEKSVIQGEKERKHIPLGYTSGSCATQATIYTAHNATNNLFILFDAK